MIPTRPTIPLATQGHASACGCDVSSRASRSIIALVLVVVTGVLAANSIARVFADGDEGPTPVGLVGVVRKIADDKKSFSLKAKKGPYTVTWTAKTVWRGHELATLGEISAGTTLHVLGQELEATASSGGGVYPPQLTKIQAVVLGEDFEPPPLPDKFIAQKVKWITGKISERDGELRIGDAVISGGRSREVLIEKKQAVPPKNVARKKEQLFIAGHLDDSERRAKKIEATEVIRLAPKFKGYVLTHDLKNRKPLQKGKPEPSTFGY